MIRPAAGAVGNCTTSKACAMLSYACAPERPILQETIYSTFLQTVARYPNADALIVPFQNLHLKFHQLATAAERVTGALRQLGLASGLTQCANSL
jgi:hypothetical protein